MNRPPGHARRDLSPEEQTAIIWFRTRVTRHADPKYLVDLIDAVSKRQRIFNSEAQRLRRHWRSFTHGIVDRPLDDSFQLIVRTRTDGTGVPDNVSQIDSGGLSQD